MPVRAVIYSFDIPSRRTVSLSSSTCNRRDTQPEIAHPIQPPIIRNA
jgi:hypothetical protein